MLQWWLLYVHGIIVIGVGVDIGINRYIETVIQYVAMVVTICPWHGWSSCVVYFLSVSTNTARRSTVPSRWALPRCIHRINPVCMHPPMYGCMYTETDG